NSIVVLDHVEECFEHSRCEGNRRSIQPEQEPFPCVELKLPELVNVNGGRLHRGFQNNSEKFSASLKTFIGVPSTFLHAQMRSEPPPGKEIKTDANNKIKNHTRRQQNEQAPENKTTKGKTMNRLTELKQKTPSF